MELSTTVSWVEMSSPPTALILLLSSRSHNYETKASFLYFIQVMISLAFLLRFLVNIESGRFSHRRLFSEESLGAERGRPKSNRMWYVRWARQSACARQEATGSAGFCRRGTRRSWYVNQAFRVHRAEKREWWHREARWVQRAQEGATRLEPVF